MSKYPPLEEPCKSCIGMCFRVENENFISDKKCKYAKVNDKQKNIEQKWIQESLWCNN